MNLASSRCSANPYSFGFVRDAFLTEWKVQMRFRNAEGDEQDRLIEDREMMQLMLNSLDAIRDRSSLIECRECGLLFLVNNQDFHQVVSCSGCRG